MVAEGQEPLADNGPAAQSVWDRFNTAILFVVFVTFRAMDRVFLKDISNALHRASYNLVWGNILWPLFIQIMTAGMLLGYISYLRCQGHTEYNLKFFLPGSPRASSVGAVPLYQMALFSLGDQLNAAISAPPSAYVSLPIQSVMSNMILVWMAIIAFFWIGNRYKLCHYLGMAIVLLSIVVQLWQKLFNSDCTAGGIQDDKCLFAYQKSDGEFAKLAGNSMLVWYGLFFLSTLPGAAGNVYKQKILQSKDVDVWYATWWSGNFQVLWGWALVWVMWIPLPDQDVLSPGQTFSEVGKTFQCFGGHAPRPSDTGCEQSPPPWIWLILYLSFNITFNMALLTLTKRMSAAWAQVATVLCLDLTNIFSQSTFLMGKSAHAMSTGDWFGTALASIALFVYNREPEINNIGAVNNVAGGSMISDGHMPGSFQRPTNQS